LSDGFAITSLSRSDLKGDKRIRHRFQSFHGRLRVEAGSAHPAGSHAGGFNIDEWVAAGGLCFEIPYSPSATNLVARLPATGAPDSPTEFVPFVE
jgi:hypothetical protein